MIYIAFKNFKDMVSQKILIIYKKYIFFISYVLHSVYEVRKKYFWRLLLKKKKTSIYNKSIKLMICFSI